VPSPTFHGLRWICTSCTSGRRTRARCRSCSPTAGRALVAEFAKVIGPLRGTPQWAARRYDLKRWTDMPRGGHFATLEQPDLLVDDIRAAARDWR
jgi:hypothetical protein